MPDAVPLTPDPTAEWERSLMACALAGGPDVARALLKRVKSPMIVNAHLSRAWSALHRLLATEDGPIDLVDAVHADLAGIRGGSPTLGDLHALSMEVPSTENAEWYAQKVVAAYARREAVKLISNSEAERTRDLPTLELLAGVEARARKLRKLLTAAQHRHEAVSARSVSSTNRPERLLSAAEQGGALLTVGNILVLAGEGGVAKSPLALSVALALAAHQDGERATLRSGLFDGVGCPVLIATYEDTPEDCAYRLRVCARTWWPADHDRVRWALERVHLLLMATRPLFGHSDNAGHYNTRPRQLSGWDDLWRAVRRIGARVVVVDPALASYTADQNAAAPVRAYLGELAAAARDHNCGVILLCHTSKASRTNNSRGTTKTWARDPFEPGAVAGSTHWTDAARGVLTLDRSPNAIAHRGTRLLIVCKANYGPARILCYVDPIRDRCGEICGFDAAGDWQTSADQQVAPPRGGKAAETANCAGAPVQPNEIVE